MMADQNQIIEQVGKSPVDLEYRKFYEETKISITHAKVCLEELMNKLNIVVDTLNKIVADFDLTVEIIGKQNHISYKQKLSDLQNTIFNFENYADGLKLNDQKNWDSISEICESYEERSKDNDLDESAEWLPKGKMPGKYIKNVFNLPYIMGHRRIRNAKFLEKLTWTN